MRSSGRGSIGDDAGLFQAMLARILRDRVPLEIARHLVHRPPAKAVLRE